MTYRCRLAKLWIALLSPHVSTTTIHYLLFSDDPTQCHISHSSHLNKSADPKKISQPLCSTRNCLEITISFEKNNSRMPRLERNAHGDVALYVWLLQNLLKIFCFLASFGTRRQVIYHWYVDGHVVPWIHQSCSPSNLVIAMAYLAMHLPRTFTSPCGSALVWHGSGDGIFGFQFLHARVYKQLGVVPIVNFQVVRSICSGSLLPPQHCFCSL